MFQKKPDTEYSISDRLKGTLAKSQENFTKSGG